MTQGGGLRYYCSQMRPRTLIVAAAEELRRTGIESPYDRFDLVAVLHCFCEELAATPQFAHMAVELQCAATNLWEAGEQERRRLGLIETDNKAGV